MRIDRPFAASMPLTKYLAAALVLAGGLSFAFFFAGLTAIAVLTLDYIATRQRLPVPIQPVQVQAAFAAVVAAVCTAVIVTAAYLL